MLLVVDTTSAIAIPSCSGNS